MSHQIFGTSHLQSTTRTPPQHVKMLKEGDLRDELIRFARFAFKTKLCNIPEELVHIYLEEERHG
jgi:hypothetical protein